MTDKSIWNSLSEIGIFPFGSDDPEAGLAEEIIQFGHSYVGGPAEAGMVLDYVRSLKLGPDEIAEAAAKLEDEDNFDKSVGDALEAADLLRDGPEAGMAPNTGLISRFRAWKAGEAVSSPVSGLFEKTAAGDGSVSIREGEILGSAPGGTSFSYTVEHGYDVWKFRAPEGDVSVELRGKPERTAPMAEALLRDGLC